MLTLTDMELTLKLIIFFLIFFLFHTTIPASALYPCQPHALQFDLHYAKQEFTVYAFGGQC